MRHQLHHRKFNRPTKQRKVLLTSLAQSLLKHERIKTTLPKAKALRPFVERIITFSKHKTLATRRRLAAALPDRVVQEKLYNDLGARFANRPGGYTRIVKLGTRFGDNADVAFIELVDKKENAPSATQKTSKGAASKKNAGEKALKTDAGEKAETKKSVATKSSNKPSDASTGTPSKPAPKK